MSARILFNRMLGLPILLGAALLGLALAIPWPALGLGITWLALAILFLLSLAPVADQLVSHLEHDHQVADLEAIPPPAYIAVLAGDLTRFPGQGATLRLGSSTRARLMYALELHHRWPQARLLVSSFPGTRNPLHRRAVAEAVAALGFSVEELIIEEPAPNTVAEIRALRAAVGSQPVVLVSSAMHMPRVMRLAGAHGLNAVAAGAEVLANPPEAQYISRWAPSSHELGKSERALHEYAGLALLRMSRSLSDLGNRKRKADGGQ